MGRLIRVIAPPLVKPWLGMGVAIDRGGLTECGAGA
jgi:hypothetical protein